ncbi:MAG: hypothetical protein NVS2B16_20690 [Chloroflexota bacterium]
MQLLLKALVVSDFPILGLTAKSVLCDRYDVETRTWKSFLDQVPLATQLVIVDITAIDCATALDLIARVLPGARVAVCSLHQNEVEVYRLGVDGPTREARISSLLQLVA